MRKQQKLNGQWPKALRVGPQPRAFVEKVDYYVTLKPVYAKASDGMPVKVALADVLVFTATGREVTLRETPTLRGLELAATG